MLRRCCDPRSWLAYLIFSIALVGGQSVGQLTLPQRQPDSALALLPGVQDELKLDEDQKKRVAEVMTGYREDVGKLGEVPQVGPLPDDEPGLNAQEQRERRLRHMEPVREHFHKVGLLKAKAAAVVEKSLTPAQRSRLHQVARQLEGPRVFSRPDVQKALNLSPEQLGQIETILNGTLSGTAMQRANLAIIERPSEEDAEKKETRDRQAEALKFFERTKDSATNQVVRTLSRKQRETLEKLLGEPIDKRKVLAGTIPIYSRPEDGDPKLRGEWTLSSTLHMGRPVPANGGSLPKIKILIDESSLKTEVAGKVISRIKLSVDPAKTPKEIDMTFETGPTKGKLRKGIYRIEGETLTYCYASPGAPRPTEFVSQDGADVFLVVAKRPKNPAK